MGQTSLALSQPTCLESSAIDRPRYVARLRLPGSKEVPGFCTRDTEQGTSNCAILAMANPALDPAHDNAVDQRDPPKPISGGRNE